MHPCTTLTRRTISSDSASTSGDISVNGDSSIVEYLAGHGGYPCCYCKSPDTNLSYGMWLHQMNVQDYQHLVNRGWRRSGRYCYKPNMKKTCCPMYTIKCDAVDFKLSKSQKKVIKRVNRYLITGRRDSDDRDEAAMEQARPTESEPKDQLVASQEVTSSAVSHAKKDTIATSSTNQQTTDEKPPPKPGSGSDPNKPVCRKAKELRAERRLQRLIENPDKENRKQPATENSPRSLEGLLKEPDHAPESVHKLELRLVRSSPRSPEFESSFTASHRVYHAYQMAIHKDPPNKPNQSQFTRFLCYSPLGELHASGGPSMGYGSFHQQYLLDGNIIAVGVFDILPHYMFSVYLYYDPAFSFLTLGVYSALREIALVRELQRHTPDLRFYCMGSVIPSCPRMNYKSNFSPSFLACPETYTWIPLDKCRPLLDKAHYSRLADQDEEDRDFVMDIHKVLVLFEWMAMPYSIYSAMNKGENYDQAEVKEYAISVGRTCAERMFLVREIYKDGENGRQLLQ